MLVIAGVYNIAWGAWVVLFPLSVFELASLEAPRYVSIWQCVGMIVGVYGVGYLAAATNPARHWPIVLVGLLGKVFGPIGFAIAASKGELPWTFGFTILTNDVVWWIPFLAILWHAAKSANPPQGEVPPFEQAIERETDQHGKSLRQLSDDRPTLVVFLRHSGCTFCKETLRDLRVARSTIASRGVGIALVHMSTIDRAEVWLTDSGLQDLPRFSDPDRVLYRAFDLGRGSFIQLFGPAVWWRGLVATLRGNLVGKLEGDGFQMPGTFILDRGRLAIASRHAHAASRVDFSDFACDVVRLDQPTTGVSA